MGPIALLLAYSAGIGCAPFLEFTRLLIALPWLAAVCWFPCRRQATFSLCLLVLFFWSLGVSLFHLGLAPPPDNNHIRAFICNRPLTIEGTVLTVTSRPLGRSAIDLEVHRVGDEGILARTRGKVRVYLEEGAAGIEPGREIRFRSRLREPRLLGTPGEFDYPRHLARQEIFAVASLEQVREVVVFAADPEKSVRSRIEGIRLKWGRMIDSRMAPDTAALVKALIVGDMGGITPEQRELLSRGGVSHLFAISGMHLGLIAVFLFGVVLILYRRSETLLLFSPPRRSLTLLLLPLLLFYLLLTGNGLPTRRAFFMSLAGGVLAFGARRTRPLHLLASVALIILLFEPLALFEPSFQLSFSGVLGMMLLLPRWLPGLEGLPRPLRWAALLCLTTLAATLATTPLVILHFHLFAPAGILSNMFAVPLVGFLAVVLGLTGGLLLPVWNDGGLLLLQGSGVIIASVLRAVEWLVAWPPLHGWRVYLSLQQTAAVTLLCAIPLIAGASRKRWLIRAFLLVFSMSLLRLVPPPPDALRITVISVGQADAFLVSCSNGKSYLVDGGGPHSRSSDVGERLLAPALGRMGIRALDAVILTHDQSDHRQGLPHILNEFPVKAFWSSQAAEELDPSLSDALRRSGVPTTRFPSGWSILEETEETTFAIFVPAGESGNLNDRSLVLYARQGDNGLLLTGDLEEAGVLELLRRPPPGPVTLLKLPHHGSRRSATELLLDRYNPRMTFVSLGTGNPFGFPHAEVLHELEKRNIPLHRTDLLGTIRFIGTAEGWRMEHWQRGLFR